MLCSGRVSLIFNRLKVTHSLRPSFSSAVFTTRCSPRRALSTRNIITEPSKDELFAYTSGRWVYNEDLRLKERMLVFDVDGLRRLAAESVNQRPEDIVSFSKLGEGGFNRAFLITFRGGRRMVARVPYPVTAPKYYAVASEVATIEYLRARGIPVPEVYGYSADSDNAAGTPYILMDFIQGYKLSEVWPSLGNDEVISVMRQLTRLESQMMSLKFPAGGSLYFTDDLEKVGQGLGVPLADKRFCVGPDTQLELWYGRRAGLPNIDRGPYQSAEGVLAASAHKEIAYLKHFGQPLLPMQRERRLAYKFQPQSPSVHVEYLKRYLSIASALIPRDPTLSRFCIRHPDFQPNNIFVSRSPDSGCKVVSLFDWQHTSILPMFLHAGIPQRFQNHDDPVSQAMTLPSLPENFHELSEAKQGREQYLYVCRLIHYHYVVSTKVCNPLHHAAFTDPFYALRGRLYLDASAPWEGDSSDLKAGLIEVMQKWESLRGGSVSCPIKFDAEDITKTAALLEEMDQAIRGFGIFQSMCGSVGETGSVLNEDYESVMAHLNKSKEDTLQDADTAEERKEIMDHWPWGDMDEDAYL